MRGSLMMVVAATFLAMVDAQSGAALPDYTCSASIAQLTPPERDPCSNTTAYLELAACFQFLTDGNGSALSADCCESVHSVWFTLPACFCKLTFMSIFPGQGSVLARARPKLCNVTDDLCKICPKYFLNLPQTGRRSNLVAVVIAISLSAILLLSGCVLLVCCRKKVFRRHYENKEYGQQCSDIRNMEGKPTIFPYHILKQATRNFDLDNKLGEGGFGIVFKGVLPDGMEVAIKKLSEKSQQGKDEFLNEVTLITSVLHRNLVKLRGCCLKSKERLLVYEYLENRSLHEALFDKPRMQLDWQTRMKILVGTARALAYLHEGCQTRIVHRDIKPSNILLDKDLSPKIADFGLARIFSENDTHVITTRIAGTWGYLAPEYVELGQLTEKADVFSYGIVALELVSGRRNNELDLQAHSASLLERARQLHEKNKVIELLDPSITWSPDTRDEAIHVVVTALLCTRRCPTQRPTMTKVVSVLTRESDIDPKPRFARIDVRDTCNLDLKLSQSTSSANRNSLQANSNVRSNGSLAARESPCSSNDISGVVRVLEPR